MSGLVFYPKSHRYKLDGEWVPGVTTILGKALAKPFLVNWAAREVANYAADNLDTLNALPDRESVYDLLSKAHERRRDKAAVRGTDVHALAEELVHGREVEVPEHLAGYVEGYARFLDKWQPTALLTERPVANRTLWYAGTFDAIVADRYGQTLIVDNKTSKSVYGEAALQLAAYSNAEFYVDPDDNEQPLPKIDGGAVVHITPTGTDLYMVENWDDAAKDWRRALSLAMRIDAIKNYFTNPTTLETV